LPDQAVPFGRGRAGAQLVDQLAGTALDAIDAPRQRIDRLDQPPSDSNSFPLTRVYRVRSCPELAPMSDAP
jgi:hypothetical protein